MIRKEELFEAGKFHKTHGVKGELSCSFNNTVDYAKLAYIVSDVDGIYVPFFVEEIRTKTSTSALIKFKNINSESDAKFLLDSPIYLPFSFQQTEDDEVDVAYFIHFSIIDTLMGKVGTIIAIDETTPNTLFCVENEKKEIIYIPVAEEFFVSIDEQTKTIFMYLPAGLIDINM